MAQSRRKVIRVQNGYDNDSALEAMGCPVDTKENLISYVCRTSFIQRQNLVHKLEYLKKVESVSIETKKQDESKIQRNPRENSRNRQKDIANTQTNNRVRPRGRNRPILSNMFKHYTWRDVYAFLLFEYVLY